MTNTAFSDFFVSLNELTRVEIAEHYHNALLKLAAAKAVCEDRHDHSEEGWGKCSISGYCEILKIIDTEWMPDNHTRNEE